MSAAPTLPHNGPVVPRPKAQAWDTRRRWTVLALAAVAAILFAVSFALPWWTIDMKAPQYPTGLQVTLSLSGVSGDVDEVNTLNHYVGMGKIDEAAQVERQFAAYLVGGVGLSVVAGVLLTGRKIGWITLLPALALPIGFVADSWYWMYRYGHSLDPTAPITFESFTPDIWLHGKIAQFETFAAPASGWYLASLATALVIGAVILRGRVCTTCPAYSKCGPACKHQLVRVPKTP